MLAHRVVRVSSGAAIGCKLAKADWIQQNTSGIRITEKASRQTLRCIAKNDSLQNCCQLLSAVSQPAQYRESCLFDDETAVPARELGSG